MTGRRIGAVVVAIALIVAALIVRRTVLDAGDADDPTGSTATTTETAAAPDRMVCITELDDVCRALRAELPDLRIDVQDAGVTLDELAKLPDDASRPLWLTVQPFPAMVDALRTANRLQPFGATADTVAASPLSVATTLARGPELDAGCSGQALWACIGTNAGGEWSSLVSGAPSGRIRPSVGRADRQAIALASFATAVGGYFGRADIRAADWQNDPAFTPWVSRLLGAVDPSTLTAGTPLATMAIRPSALDIAATTDAELSTFGGDRFAANYPRPSMWAEVVLAVPEGSSAPDDLVTTLAPALSAAGWDGASTAAQSVPSATTMLALRALWQETTS